MHKYLPAYSSAFGRVLQVSPILAYGCANPVGKAMMRFDVGNATDNARARMHISDLSRAIHSTMLCLNCKSGKYR